MQNLTQLHHFKLVAQEGSFARAAELAHITQPALSNSIRSLETRLGMTLFERSERPVRLTAAGRNIIARVEAILFQSRNLEQTLANLNAGTGGHIRLGVPPVFSTALAGPIIAEWHNAFPNVTLDMIVRETVELKPTLRDEMCDVIVGDMRDMRSHVEDMDLVELSPQSGGAYCRPGHPILTIRNPLPRDLSRYKLAGPQFPEDVLRDLAKFLGIEWNGAEPLIAVTSHNIAALRDAVAESDLVLLTTAGTVRNQVSLGILKKIPIDIGVSGVWTVATLKGKVHHPAVPRLIDKIVDISRREHENRIAATRLPSA
ncbi:LysR family transcriptional regulator [Shimia aestuarii]|uniref:DNA-binding transcriptional regulator, LysR family n=1 Tax=Shimia aestuarii TaxID=254406 RepID=A0A1I4RNP8_9RHOB|nr:LysR family transcriptional regulator [Shimia aestuarii]SFM53855.1 DNA-binding transcriptional regulator, LysR family [Shimia aestuarii]